MVGVPCLRKFLGSPLPIYQELNNQKNLAQNFEMKLFDAKDCDFKTKIRIEKKFFMLAPIGY